MLQATRPSGVELRPQPLLPARGGRLRICLSFFLGVFGVNQAVHIAGDCQVSLGSCFVLLIFPIIINAATVDDVFYKYVQRRNRNRKAMLCVCVFFTGFMGSSVAAGGPHTMPLLEAGREFALSPIVSGEGLQRKLSSDAPPVVSVSPEVFSSTHELSVLKNV